VVANRFLQNTLNCKKKKKYFVLLLLHVKNMPTGATCIDGEVRTPHRQNTVQGDRGQLPECVCLSSLEGTAVFEKKPYMEKC
jgi:hypothetical protein